MARRKPYSPGELSAWHDSWTTAGREQPNTARPAYSHNEDREAFNVDWDERADRMAMGYTDRDSIPESL